jgi:hypothetical protein
LEEIRKQEHCAFIEKYSYRLVVKHSSHAERQVQRSVEDDEHIIDVVQRSPRTSTRISARLRIPRMRVWRTLHTEGMYPCHIKRVQHLEPADMCSRFDLCRWINSNPRVIRKFCLPTRPIVPAMESTISTRNSHLWGRDNPYGTVKSNYQHRFSVNVWFSLIADQLIGPYIFPQRLTGAIYANLL